MRSIGDAAKDRASLIIFCTHMTFDLCLEPLMRHFPVRLTSQRDNGQTTVDRVRLTTEQTIVISQLVQYQSTLSYYIKPLVPDCISAVPDIDRALAYRGRRDSIKGFGE